MLYEINKKMYSHSTTVCNTDHDSLLLRNILLAKSGKAINESTCSSVKVDIISRLTRRYVAVLWEYFSECG